MSAIGFGSTPWIASGPFRWTLQSGVNDRYRFILHRGLIDVTSAVKLRGGPSLSLRLRRLVGEYQDPLVATADDIRISFDGFDRYWMQVFFRRDFYEPDMYRLFRRAKNLGSFHFIDGGANIGFWSAVLTSHGFGVRKAVAIEASPTTFENLIRTADLCANRFDVVHRALSSRRGPVVFEQGLRHESRRISLNNDDTSTERITVEASTVDHMIEDHGLDIRNSIVKLDVEGAELDCVTGGMAAFEAGAVLVYEDHGKDAMSKLTGQLLERGFVCWFIDDEGALRPVRDASEASAFKPNPKRGYNFVATVNQHAALLQERLGIDG